MSWVAVAIAGSAVIGAVSTYYAGEQSKGASEEASKRIAESQKEGIDLEWEMYQQMREDYAPWREAGEKALGTLQEKIAAGPGEFEPEKTPGYQFGFKNFIETPYLSSQSAKGKRLSGETVKGLTKYASDYAETAYDNFLNRYYQGLNPHQSLAGMGMTGLGQQTQAGTQITSSVANMMGNIGNAQYQNALNQGQISSGSTMAYGGIGQQAINNYMNYMVMKKLGAT